MLLEKLTARATWGDEYFRLIPNNFAPLSNRSTGLNYTLCEKFSILLHVFIACCTFQTSPDYQVCDIKIKMRVLFFLYTFAPLTSLELHPCSQVYQHSHAHIYAHLNLQYRIVLLAWKAQRREVYRARQLFGHGPAAAYHANF